MCIRDSTHTEEFLQRYGGFGDAGGNVDNVNFEPVICYGMSSLINSILGLYSEVQ